MADVWIEITDGKFKDFRFHVSQPIKGGDTHGVTNIQQRAGRRVQVIKRPFVDGGRTKDLGKEPRQITVDIVFFGDNYLVNLADFEIVLNEGTSGKLILPDEPEAINATFLTIDKTSRAGDTRSKTVRVSWIEDEIQEATEQAFGAAEGFLPKGLLEAANTLDSVVAGAFALVRNNPIIATIRQIETVTSVASNAFINAVGLVDEVRGRVLTTAANLENAYNGMVNAKDQLLLLFGVEEEGSGFESGTVDPDTGNPVEDGLIDDDEVESPDPLAPPDVEPDTAVEPVSLETAEGVLAFQDEILALLESSTEQLATDTKGRTDDVTGGTNDVANAFRDVVLAATPRPRKLVQTPFEFSLAEILFYNDIPLEDLEDVYRKNTFIDNIHVVPRGSIIQL